MVFRMLLPNNPIPEQVRGKIAKTLSLQGETPDNGRHSPKADERMGRSHSPFAAHSPFEFLADEVVEVEVRLLEMTHLKVDI